jgi:DNA-binding NtrC family response regulator
MRLAACARGSVITADDDFQDIPGPPVQAAPAPTRGKPESLKSAIAELEKRMIAEALAQTHNNQQRAARLLDLSRQGLINKMKRYSL